MYLLKLRGASLTRRTDAHTTHTRTNTKANWLNDGLGEKSKRFATDRRVARPKPTKIYIKEGLPTTRIPKRIRWKRFCRVMKGMYGYLIILSAAFGRGFVLRNFRGLTFVVGHEWWGGKIQVCSIQFLAQHAFDNSCYVTYVIYAVSWPEDWNLITHVWEGFIFFVNVTAWVLCQYRMNN